LGQVANIITGKTPERAERAGKRPAQNSN